MKVKTYKSLKALAQVYSIFGYIVMILGVIFGILQSFDTSRFSPGLAGGIPIIIFSIITGITMIASAELIEIIFEFLENSREQTRYLRFLASKQASAPKPESLLRKK